MADLAVACHGEFVPHRPRSAFADLDFSYLLHDRSKAMGWLDDVGAAVTVEAAEGTGDVQTHSEPRPGSTGLWTVYDAEHHVGLASRGSPVLWARVGIGPVPAERPLPVQPLFRCVGDVVERIGALRLVAAEALLPVQQLDAASREKTALGPLGTSWFTDRDPGARTALQVTLDSGSDPSIVDVAAPMQAWLQQVDQAGFDPASVSLSDHPDLALASTFFDDLRGDRGHHRATFCGTLAEWSLDAVGWLATLLAGASASYGVPGPLLLTAVRIEDSTVRHVA